MLVEMMLHRQTTERIAMDEDVKIGERPGVEPLDGAYLVRGDSFEPDDEKAIKWDDNRHGLLTFETYEDRFRHVLRVYKVPEEWIDAFCKARPRRKWTCMDMDMLIGDYRRTNMTLEQVLDWLGKETI